MGELFKLQAIMSLTDNISGPLQKIQDRLGNTEKGAYKLSNRLMGIAKASLPIASAGAGLLGFLSACSMSTIETEQALNSAARSGIKDLASLEEAAAQASASWAGITKAGFVATAETIHREINNLSDATVTKLTSLVEKTSTATGVASEELANFMGYSFDTYRKFYNDMSDLQFGEMMAESLAASDQVFGLRPEKMAQALQGVGMEASLRGVGLNEQMAVLGTIMADLNMEAGEAASSYKMFFLVGEQGFGKLGIKTQDAAGKMRSLPDMLADLETQLAGLGEKARMDKITEAFGPRYANLIAKFAGRSGELQETLDKLDATVGVSTGRLDSMAGIMNKGLGPSLKLLKQNTSLLGEELGKLLAPAIAWAAQKAGELVKTLREMAKSPIGRFILKLAAILAGAAVAFTGLMAAASGLAAFLPLIKDGLRLLLPILQGVAAAVLAIGWPIWLVIGVLGLLAWAWHKNLGGIQEKVENLWRIIKTVFSGIAQVFSTFDGQKFSVDLDTANTLKDSGLWGIITTVGQILYGLKEMWTALWGELSAGLDQAWEILAPLGEVFSFLGTVCMEMWDDLSGLFSSTEAGQESVSGSVSVWRELGAVIGWLAGWAFKILAVAIRVVVTVIAFLLAGVFKLVSGVIWLGQVIAAIPEKLISFFSWLYQTIVDLQTALFGFSPLEWIVEGFQTAIDWLSNLNLSEIGAKIIGTLADGVLGAGKKLWDGVTGVFDFVSDLLPNSDAKVGPFSNLSGSGAAIPETLAGGVKAQGGVLSQAVGETMGQAQKRISALSSPALTPPKTLETPALSSGKPMLARAAGSLGGLAAAGVMAASPVPALETPLPGQPLLSPPAIEMPADSPLQTPRREPEGTGGQRSIVIQNLNITLPQVDDGESFMESLRRVLEQYDA